MMDQQNFEAARPASADSHLTVTPGHPASVESLAKGVGLKLGDQNQLTIRRIKLGKSYSFVRANVTAIRHTGTIKRLHSMAVPPAYAEVRYAPDPNSHLQAVGRDAAGRLQYRYHSDWEKVREQRKAHRLARLVAALPKIRRNVSMHLSGDEPTRDRPAAIPLPLGLGKGPRAAQGPSPGAAGRGIAEDPPQRLDAPVRRRADPRSAGCNTATTRIGKRSASSARPIAWRGWSRHCRRSAATSRCTCQATSRPEIGRLQYRYHSDWEKVREQRKAHRLARLVAALPKIRRNVSMHLSGDEPTREFALSAVIELIARTAIRPGNESYARLNGTRGATTLLKSNVVLEDDCVVLTFKAKGGKAVRKECDAAKLVRAIGILRGVPGKRMFQYRDNSGNVRAVSTTQVNAFLREIAGIKISLKDFRTLMASAVVLESLSRISPAASARGRRKQVLEG